MNEDFLSQILELKEKGESAVVVTIVTVLGSAPQEVGAKIIVGKNGLIFGTIGGGKIEAKAISYAQELFFMSEKHQFLEWNLKTDVGMTCGGVVGLFFEKILFQSDFKIAVFGAGHVGQELVSLLVKLDCNITCVDPRTEWLNKLPNHFRLKKIQTEDMKSVLKDLDPKTFIVSVTMGHAFDLPIINEALSQFSFPYIGVIGSESKASVLKKDLEKNGIDQKVIGKLHCPIGESFGKNNPFEIALSIVTQLIQLRDCAK